MPLWLLAKWASRPRTRWVEVRLDPHPVEIDSAQPLLQRLLQRRTGGARLRSIIELRALFDMVGADDAIDGVVVHVPHLRCGFATCQSLRAALQALREHGKRTVAFLPYGGGNRELYVALAADRVLAPPQAGISLLGAASQTLYFKPLLDRIGLQAEVLAHGEYKTAAEPALRDSMSEPQREQLAALLEVVQRELEAAVAARPGFDVTRARALFETGIWVAVDALQQGVIDGCCYEDELPAALSDGGQPAVPLRHSRYLAFRKSRLWRRVRPGPQIAVVRVHGAIATAAPRLPGSRVATFEAVAAALRRARENSRVHGVLLHVDSPGGSALASDLIHREIVRVREKKPVVACLGDVAASGGYYVAAPCNRIIAEATTLTGSIGVVSLRMLASDLAERLGIRPQTLRSAPHADLHSPFRALQQDERALLWAETEAIYRTFVRVVAEGRSRTLQEIEGVARGRVWAGADALGHGLVDELGGVPRAIAALRELAPALRDVPPRHLELRLTSAGRGEPPAPALPRAARWMPLWPGVPSEIGEVAALIGEGERALCYGAVPELW